MIDDVDLERCKVSALRAKKLGLLRLNGIQCENRKTFLY